MQRVILQMASAVLVVAGLIMIWKGPCWLGCAAIVCGGAVAGIRRARGASDLPGSLLIFLGFLLFLAGGYLLYSGRTVCGIGSTLLAAVPWMICGRGGEKGYRWFSFFSFTCFAFWTFGAALLFRGQAAGALLLGGSLVPWYAMERVSGRRLILSFSLLGEVAAWCGAAAALAWERYVLCAVLIALFLISRLVDDYLLVRKGFALSEGGEALSFRAYLNLDRDDARELRSLAQDSNQ
jgi:hypothetical protein